MGFKATLARYYQFSKPGIIYANVLTAAAGYLLASKFAIHLGIATGLIIGLALLIAGACASNNCLDSRIDAQMQRTKTRSLVTGTMSRPAAIAYSAFMSLSGMALLIATQNRLTAILAAVAYLDYVVLYGIAKRKTVHGTLVGCVSGAIPLVAGYTAVTNQLDLSAWLLFGLMVTWQMAHFYGIALYRLQDYAKAGLPVMPAVYGAKTTRRQVLLYILLFIGMSVGLVVGGTIGYGAGLALALAGVYWLVKVLRSYANLTDPVWGKQVFLTSLVVMLVMSVSLSFGRLVA